MPGCSTSVRRAWTGHGCHRAGPRSANQDESPFERSCSLALARRCAVSCFLTVNLLHAKLLLRLCLLLRSSLFPRELISCSASRPKDSGSAEDSLAGSRQPDPLESLVLAVPLRLLPVIVMASALRRVGQAADLPLDSVSSLSCNLTILVPGVAFRPPCPPHCSSSLLPLPAQAESRRAWSAAARLRRTKRCCPRFANCPE
jgi:hypothetical protein